MHICDPSVIHTVHPLETGRYSLSSENPSSKTDQMLIKQNNIIINLLFLLRQKVNKIEKALQNKPSTSRQKLDKGLEEVLKGIQNLKVGENTTKLPFSI